MDEEALYRYAELEDERQFDLFLTFSKLYQTGKVEHKHIPWEVIPANKLIKIWKDYIKFGFVRDEKGIDRMQEILLDNVIKIDLANILGGHEVVGAIESKLEFWAFEDMFPDVDPDEFIEQFSEWTNEPDGSWRISDYGINPLKTLAIKLIAEKSYEGKLLLIDQMLNVVHQRSDLARWFVEGGSKTLQILKNE